mmetsp:Transcript_27076/g.50879  ORF Transcript_27076/g.50879 Transcript_27076/m.50879 type:complete len:233 (-) Transcript_27076:178-876(-)
MLYIHADAQGVVAAARAPTATVAQLCCATAVGIHNIWQLSGSSVTCACPWPSSAAAADCVREASGACTPLQLRFHPHRRLQPAVSRRDPPQPRRRGPRRRPARRSELRQGLRHRRASPAKMPLPVTPCWSLGTSGLSPQGQQQCVIAEGSCLFGEGDVYPSQKEPQTHHQGHRQLSSLQRLMRTSPSFPPDRRLRGQQAPPRRSGGLCHHTPCAGVGPKVPSRHQKSAGTSV